MGQAGIGLPETGSASMCRRRRYATRNGARARAGGRSGRHHGKLHLPRHHRHRDWAAPILPRLTSKTGSAKPPGWDAVDSGLFHQTTDKLLADSQPLAANSA